MVYYRTFSHVCAIYCVKKTDPSLDAKAGGRSDPGRVGRRLAVIALPTPPVLVGDLSPPPVGQRRLRHEAELIAGSIHVSPTVQRWARPSPRSKL